MKTTADRIKHIEYLIKRKDRIRIKHLLAIKKHLAEVKQCEEYIKKHEDEIIGLRTIVKN